MADMVLNIHHITPQLSKIQKAVEYLQDGAVLLYPTDTGFALGCSLSHKNAIDKIRAIRKIDESKNLTFLCPSLSNIAEYAKVSNVAYRMLKGLIPGPYTFILPATKSVPRYAQNPKRNTTGIRVPDSAICQALLQEKGAPIISITAKDPADEAFLSPEDLVEKLSPLVDIVITADEYHFVGDSTVIDMTSDVFEVLRPGAGMDAVEEYIQAA